MDGFKIQGEMTDNTVGRSVSDAGDLNGDGFGDVIVGSNIAGSYSGVSYVVFGQAGGFAANLDLSILDGSNGFEIKSAAEGDFTGGSASAAGDVNGDGFDDLIIGASGSDPNGDLSGAAFVVFGKRRRFAATLNLSDLNGNNGFKIQGEAADDIAGTSVSGAGDVNGDGFADIIVGANGADPNGSRSGASYVVFGKAQSFGATVNLSTLNGSNGFKIQGEAADDYSGSDVSGAGDVNGDGFADLVIGASGADPNGERSGASYVVFGKAAGFGATLDLATLDGDNGFKLKGTAAGDYSGRSVSGAGDVNGDGFSDIIVGANGSDINGPYFGASYVVFGKASGFTPTLALSMLDGSNGFIIPGKVDGKYSGFSVSAAGDVNGDGLDDIIIGAPRSSITLYSGSSYVVFGKQTSFAGLLDLATLDGSNGFTIGGGTGAGSAVSSAGDINGDGADDLIIGVARQRLFFGASYVVFGQSPYKQAFDAKHPFTFFDANHDKVTVKLTGPGRGNLLLNGDAVDGADISKIKLSSTTTKSTLSVTVKKDKALGDGTVTIGAVTADGLRSFKAPAADLIGDGLSASGPIKSIAIRSLTHGAIATTGAIGKITVKGGSISGELVADSFGAIAITGGDLTGDIRATDRIGKINVKASKLAGGNITGASIFAEAIASLSVAKNVAGSIILAGANLGADKVLGGGNDTFIAGTIGAVKIGGNVSGGSVIGAGLSPTDGIFNNGDDTIIDGIASIIKSLTIGGTAAPDSYFATGKFKAAPKIGGVKIAPTTDGRFLVA